MSAARRRTDSTVDDQDLGEDPDLLRALGSSAMANDNVIFAAEREVMNVEEVAAFLGVDRKTVYDYAGRGEIPCRRLGKRILFSRRALVLWLGGACSNASSNGEMR